MTTTATITTTTSVPATKHHHQLYHLVDWQDLGRPIIISNDDIIRSSSSSSSSSSKKIKNSNPPDDDDDDDNNNNNIDDDDAKQQQQHLPNHSEENNGLSLLIERNFCMLEHLLATALAWEEMNTTHSDNTEDGNSTMMPSTTTTTTITSSYPLLLSSSSSSQFQLPHHLSSQLHNYITEISSRYHNVGFHSFEHASHVVWSAYKFVTLLQQRCHPFSFFPTTSTTTEDDDDDDNKAAVAAVAAVAKDGYDDDDDSDDDNTNERDYEENVQKQQQQQQQHSNNISATTTATIRNTKHLQGTIYDPWLHVAIVLAALIHDVDHRGIPNHQLRYENDPLTTPTYYGNPSCLQSYAEWNSLHIGLSILRTQPEFKELESILGGGGRGKNKEEYDDDDDDDDDDDGTSSSKETFYKMVTNLVLCTDIASKERRELGMERWNKTTMMVGGSPLLQQRNNKNDDNEQTIMKNDGGEHSDNTTTNDDHHSSSSSLSLALSYSTEDVSVIAEQIIQAADVSHTMQHFTTFVKWNTNLYHEILAAYQCGRTSNPTASSTAPHKEDSSRRSDVIHPRENWYESQIGFFDFYVIPLAQRLDACGIFPKEYQFAQLAAKNKKQWIDMGRECTSKMVRESEVIKLPPPIMQVASTLAPPKITNEGLLEVITTTWESNDDNPVDPRKSDFFESNVSITAEDKSDIGSSQPSSIETSSRFSRNEGASFSSRMKMKWGRTRRSSLLSSSSFYSKAESSVNAIVPHVCVKQLIDSFHSSIAHLPPNLRMDALRDAMSEYQSNGLIQRHRGALLFVDISGFTELSQMFNVEDFKNFINDYFTKIIELIHNFGGEVVKFAGDALIAVWMSNTSNGSTLTAERNTDESDGGNSRSGSSTTIETIESTHHALNVEKCTACAIAINVECKDYRVSKTYQTTTRHDEFSEQPDTTVDSHLYDERKAILTVYCGVSEGVMAGVNVVADNRAEFFLVGDPLKDAATAEHLAGPGESVISPSVFRILQNRPDTRGASKMIFAKIDQSEDGNNIFYKVLCSHPSPVENVLLYFDECGASSFKQDAQLFINDLVETTEETDETSESLRNDLMQFFEHHRHEAARDVVGTFTAELRRVVVLFISIEFEPTLLDDPSEDKIILDKFQSIYSIISSSISVRSGQIRQFIYDDKGTVFIASFGLRNSVMLHPSDTAIYAAKEVKKNLLEALAINCSIGITLGNIFCGETGSLQRYEYSLLGPSVNLSARLMAQGGWGEIICDEEVRNHAGQKHTFTIRGMYSLKGYTRPIPFYIPVEHELEKKDFEQDDIVTYFMQKLENTELVRNISKRDNTKDIQPRLFLITGDQEKGTDAFISAILKQPMIRDSSNVLKANRCFHDDPFYCFIPIITRIILSFQEFRARIEYLKKNRKSSSTLALFLAHHTFQREAIFSGSKPVPDELEPFLSLINDFVFKGFPLFEISLEAKQLKQNQIDKCVEVIFALIVRYFELRKKPGILAIPELDMVDEYSKKLLRRIFCSQTSLVIIGGVNSSMSNSEDAMKEDFVAAICSNDSSIGTDVFQLQLLDKQSTFDLFAWSLRREFTKGEIDSMSYPDIQETLFRLCRGMPHATTRLAHAFCTQQQKYCQLNDGGKKPDTDVLDHLQAFLDETPADFEEFIWFRMDHMKPEEQTLLKIASVAGYDQYSFSQNLLESVLLAISSNDCHAEYDNNLENDLGCLPHSVCSDVPNSISNENKINYMFQGDYFERMLDSLVAHSFLEEVNIEMSDLSSMESVMYRFRNNREQLVINGLMLDDQKQRTHYEVAKYYSSSISKVSISGTGDSSTENDSLLSSNYGVLNVIALHYELADAPILAMLYYYDSSSSLYSLGVRDKAHGLLKSSYSMLRKMLRNASMEDTKIFSNLQEERRCTVGQMIRIIVGDQLKDNLKVLSKLTKNHLRLAFGEDIQAFKSGLTMLIKFGQSVGTIEKEGFLFASKLFTEAIMLLLIVLEDGAFNALTSSVASFFGQSGIQVSNKENMLEQTSNQSLSRVEDPHFFGIDDLTVCFPAFSGLLTFYRDCHISVTLTQETFLANLFVAVTQEANEMIHIVRAKCVVSHLYLKHANYLMALKECEEVRMLYDHDKFSLELVRIYGLDWALICISTMTSTYVYMGQFAAAHDNIEFLKRQMVKLDEFASSTKPMFKGIVASCYLLLHEFENAADMAKGISTTKYGYYFKPLCILQEELAHRKLALYNQSVFKRTQLDFDLLSVLASNDIDCAHHQRTMLHKSSEMLSDQGIEALQAALCASEVRNFELSESINADILIKQIQYCQAGLLYLKQTSIQTDVNNHKNYLLCLYQKVELLLLHQRLRQALQDSYNIEVDDKLKISGTEINTARLAIDECRDLSLTNNYLFMQLLVGKRYIAFGLDPTVGESLIQRALRCLEDADCKIAKNILSLVDSEGKIAF